MSTSAHLAEELWYMVFMCLDYNTIPKAQLVCSLFNSIGSSNGIWKKQCAHHFIDESLYFKSPPEKLNYKHLFKRLKGIDLNGNWSCYTMREGQEQEENLREKSIYLSTQIEKKSQSPPTIDSLYTLETTSTTSTSTSTSPSASSSSSTTSTTTTTTTTTITEENTNGDNSPYYQQSQRDEEDEYELTNIKRQRINSRLPSTFSPFSKTTEKPIMDFAPCAFLGIGKASWGDMVVLGCQWGQFNCSVQIYFHSNFRTICLYESSPSGRAMIGGFYTNWCKLLGATVMCASGTPRSTAWQAMSHAWTVYHSTRRWEGLIGDWVITFTYQDGREQAFTFAVKTQRKIGFNGIIKGIYSRANEIPMLDCSKLHCNSAEKKLQRSSFYFQNTSDGVSGIGFPTFATPTVEVPNDPDSVLTAAGVDRQSNEDDDDDEDLEDEEDQEQPEDPTSTHPPLLGTVIDHCVGLSFYTLGGTAFGKFITCVGQIEAAASKSEQVVHVANDEYVIRDIALRGYFMEKLLDPHADHTTTPCAEEGVWRAVRRTCSFHMDACVR